MTSRPGNSRVSFVSPFSQYRFLYQHAPSHSSVPIPPSSVLDISCSHFAFCISLALPSQASAAPTFGFRLEADFAVEPLSPSTHSLVAPSMASTTVEQVEMTPTSTAAPTPRSASPVAESAKELFDASDSREAFESYPDSGVLAWTQVASAFALFFTTMGGVYSWGVFQDALVAEGLAPSSTLAFIGSTQVSLEAIFAIPIGRLVGAFGPRRVAIVGSLFTGLGPVIAGSFVNSYGALLVFEGLMYGLGAALCFFSVATLPSQYFLRRRNLATGLVYAGSGVGGAIFSIITSQLLKRVSLAWTFRIIGLLMTAINLPAALTLKARAAKKPLRSKEKGQAFDLYGCRPLTVFSIFFVLTRKLSLQRAVQGRAIHPAADWHRGRHLPSLCPAVLPALVRHLDRPLDHDVLLPSRGIQSRVGGRTYRLRPRCRRPPRIAQFARPLSVPRRLQHLADLAICDFNRTSVSAPSPAYLLSPAR